MKLSKAFARCAGLKTKTSRWSFYNRAKKATSFRKLLLIKKRLLILNIKSKQKKKSLKTGPVRRAENRMLRILTIQQSKAKTAAINNNVSAQSA